MYVRNQQSITTHTKKHASYLQRHSRTSNRSSLTVSQKAPQARQVEAEMELGELVSCNL